MKIIKRILIIFIAFFLILWLANTIYFKVSDYGVNPFSCRDYAMTVPPFHDKITVGDGPEDFAVDYSTGDMRLIVSCSNRRDPSKNGQFYAFNLKTNRSIAMTVIPKELSLKPHGIDIAVVDSIPYLYVINHVGKDKIIRFEIKGDSLIFDADKILADAENFKALNDLDVLSDGSLFASNYMQDAKNQIETLMTIYGAKTGSVVYCDAQGDCQIVLTDKSYPNGILVDESKKQLFIAHGGGQEIQQYQIAPDASLSLIKSTKESGVLTPIADNLMFDQAGMIWTTTHPCPLKFVKHKAEKGFSPSQIFKIDPNTLKAEMVYQNNGEEISAASTALRIDNKIYVAQVFDPFLLVIEQ